MAQNQTRDYLSGVEKASILMMSLDEEVASKLFSQMTEDEIRMISQTMSKLGKISKDNVDDLMKEFSDELSSGRSVIGDISSAKKILTKALGADKVESIMGDISGPMGKDTWDKLNNVAGELLASFLKNEHPQTSALILSKVKASKTAEVLSVLPQELSLNIIKRMIALEPVKREVISDIENILQNEFMTSLSSSQETDSFEMIAEIFNNFDRSTEGKFFELLDKNDPESSERIRELMFTFDDLFKIDNAGIQAIIRNADKEKLPIALKGANDEIKELFFKNMSERASKILKEDMESLGPVRISDVDEAQLALVQTAKQLADSGEIIIPEGGDDEEEQMIY
jgi:flagellar motor switch protein FliG